MTLSEAVRLLNRNVYKGCRGWYPAHAGDRWLITSATVGEGPDDLTVFEALALGVAYASGVTETSLQAIVDQEPDLDAAAAAEFEWGTVLAGFSKIQSEADYARRVELSHAGERVYFAKMKELFGTRHEAE